MQQKLTWKKVDQLIADYTQEIVSPALVTNPVVSVFFPTYNHAVFVEQALDSVLMQETDFPFEIVIGEDASTDSTFDIVHRYQRAHPDKINLLRSTQNLGYAAIPAAIRLFRACRGKYIAMIEGDDYWTDPNKLQKQVDYLEAHPDAAGCFTDCIIVDDSGEEIDPRPFWNDSYEQSYDQKACLADLVSCYGTAALIFRSQVINHGLPDYFLKAGSDFLLDLMITEHGTLDYLTGITSAYRIHLDGIWQGTSALTNANSMITRICLLYDDENFMARHEEAVNSSFLIWSSIFSQHVQREHLSLYEAISLYLMATLGMVSLSKCPAVKDELSKLFDQRWHDNLAASHPLRKRLMEACRLYSDFPAARSFIVSKLSHYALLCIKRRLRLG